MVDQEYIQVTLGASQKYTFVETAVIFRAQCTYTFTHGAICVERPTPSMFWAIGLRTQKKAT